jgi:hypothetical protein
MHATELIFLLIVVGSIVAFVKLNSGEALRFETTSSARQITMTAVGLVATKRKWNTLSQGDGSANFAYHRGTNKLILVLLLVFFVVPGIVYWILSGKKESLAINTEEHPGGMTIVQIASNGWRGKAAGRALRSQIGLAPGTSAAVSHQLNTTTAPVLNGTVAPALNSTSVAVSADAAALHTEV